MIASSTYVGYLNKEIVTTVSDEQQLAFVDIAVPFNSSKKVYRVLALNELAITVVRDLKVGDLLFVQANPPTVNQDHPTLIYYKKISRKDLNL
jgi:hypothetical protein